MPLPFDTGVESVPLARSPLTLVVCQVRFPTILRLTTGEAPEAVQEALAETYPITDKVRVVTVGEEVPAPVSYHWTFATVERDWVVSLGPVFASLETTKYDAFDHFAGRFEELIGIVRRHYNVGHQHRFGLRYIDEITDTQPCRMSDGWPRQIESTLLPLSSSDEPRQSKLEVRLRRSDHILAIRSLFIGKDFPGSDGMNHFKLDTDCFTEGTARLDGIPEQLRRFATSAYDVFRWAVGDLLRAFGPLRKEP